MIRLYFEKLGSTSIIMINNNSLHLCSDLTGNTFVPIDYIRFDRDGVLKEFPDLSSRDDWRDEALKRFKQHISELPTEDMKADYVIKDLSQKHGFIPTTKIKDGFRPVRLS